MRLNEITGDIRTDKKKIDRLFSLYTHDPSSGNKERLTIAIGNLYPTGYENIDASLEEYMHLVRELKR